MSALQFSGSPGNPDKERQIPARHAMRVRRLMLRGAAASKSGTLFPLGSRRIMRGDPSWFSKLTGIHWGNVLKPIASVAETAIGAATGNVGLAAMGGMGIASLFKKKRRPVNRSAAKAMIRSTAGSLFRSPGGSSMGRAAGPFSALSPAAGGIRIFRGDDFTDLFSGSGGLDDGSGSAGTDWSSLLTGGADDGSDPLSSLLPSFLGGGGSSSGAAAPVTSSSGLGSLLSSHFFGNSHSKAIPIKQTGGIRPRGYHANKHGYFLSSISTWIMPGTVWVPNRRRNPLNPRALHRSIARLVSAKHAVKRLHILDTPRRPRRQLRPGRIPPSRRLKAG